MSKSIDRLLRNRRHLEVRTWFGDADESFALPDGYTWGTGCSLADGRRRVKLYVPPGDVELRVRRPSDIVLNQMMAQMYEVLHTERFLAVLGKTAKVRANMTE